MKPFENSTFIRTTMQIQSQGPSTGLQASLPHLRVRFDSFSEEEKNYFYVNCHVILVEVGFSVSLQYYSWELFAIQWLR